MKSSGKYEVCKKSVKDVQGLTMRNRGGMSLLETQVELKCSSSQHRCELQCTNRVIPCTINPQASAMPPISTFSYIH